MKTILAAILACPIVFVSGTTGFAGCLDLSKGEPKVLAGKLDYRIFPGAPGFADLAKGDTPEPGFLLTLPAPICLTGDEFADPSAMFDEVQVVADGPLARKLRKLEGKTVTIDVSNALAAETGHHHRPLVVWAKAAETGSRPPAEYASARLVVEGFYRALEKGDGALAAGFVVPEKNRRGPFSPAEISRYFGTLPEPLVLTDLRQNKTNSFDATYHYRSATGFCDGRATVLTEKRGGRHFIKSIKALNGC